MEEKKITRVNATLVASFGKPYFEDEVKFELLLDVKDEVTQENIMKAFIDRLALCLYGHAENTPVIFAPVDKGSNSYIINLAQVKYFYVDDWHELKEEEK